MAWVLTPSSAAWACLWAVLVSLGLRCYQLQVELDQCLVLLDEEVPVSSAAADGGASSSASADRSKTYRTNLLVHEATRRPSRDMTNVTLVTHVTLDRAPRLARLCQSWRGPMSVSVFRRPHDLKADVPSVAAAVAAHDPCIRRHADLHEVELSDAAMRRLASRTDALSKGMPAADEKNASDMFTHYPFNVQRNAAVDGATGEWVFLLDVDFVIAPSEAARERIFSKKFHALRAANPDFYGFDDRTISVVPAVETVTPSVDAPTTFDALFESLTAKSVCSFYGHYCTTCHHPTMVEKFAADAVRKGNTRTASAARPYRVQYREGYEPYVVAARSTLPRYDERFIGRGWDKMSFFYELNAMGRKFVVLPAPMPFLVHSGRGDMPTNHTREYMERQRDNVMLMHNFKASVQQRYHSDEMALSAREKERISKSVRIDENEADAAMREALKPSSSVPEWTRTPSEQQPAAPKQPAPSTPSPLASAAPTTRSVRRADGQASLIDWDTISSSRGGSKACIAAYRGETLDNVTTPLLEGALGYACERIDCRPLQLGGLRHFPNTLVSHADWAFDRYLEWAVKEKGEDPEQACHFGGAAKLVPCAQQCFGCQTVSDATDERIGHAIEWVCGPDGLGNCGALLAAVRGNTTRSVADKASVLFSFHHLVHRCVHVNPDEACYFGGAARRVPCSQLPD